MAECISSCVQAPGSYSEADREWRSWQEKQDKWRKEFYEELCVFPNLFSLKSVPLNCELIEALLRRQEGELEEGLLRYHLEKVRCHNLIIFCKLLLGRKHDALKYCEDLKIDTSKSIIFLTLKAVLQLEFNRYQECTETMENLHNMYKIPEIKYLLAVAESEKGYFFICIGPTGFLKAMDHFQKAIDNCPNADIYLWKYDLALAIRRNFNVHVYSEHSKFSPSELGERARSLLLDVVEKCPNEAFRAWAQIEFARLVSHLNTFSDVCLQDEEKRKVQQLFKDYDENACYEAALLTNSGSEDFYVLRECGRHFVFTGQDYERAVNCLEKSYCRRGGSMICQLFGKAYLAMYRSKKKYFSDWVIKEVPGLLQNNPNKVDSRSPQVQEGVEDCARPVLEEKFGGISMESQESEEVWRLAELDSTPYMDKDGNLLTTQAVGFGNIYPLSSSPGRVPLQHACSDDETLRRKLLSDFDKDIYLDEHGNFKTTQHHGIVGNLPVPQQFEAERKPPLKKLQSFPPSAARHHAPGLSSSDDVHSGGRDTSVSFSDQIPQGKVSSRRSSFPPEGDKGAQRRISNFQRTKQTNPCFVLKSKIRKYSYDATDPRVITAEYFYCKGCELCPTNSTLLFDIGILYEGMGNSEKALEYYHKIVGQYNLSNHIMLVNAYERIGLCLMEQSESCKEESERSKLKGRAIDMFMTSMVECRKAVAHLPQVNAKRSSLWNSYPRLLEILHESDPDAKTRKKEARAHEVVGKYLKAVAVYQEVMELARQDTDRVQGLHGTVKNYYRMGNVKEAKFILDLFLTVEEDRHWMLTDRDRDTTTLRETAVKIYSKSGKDSLEEGNVTEARSAFKTALLMKGRVHDRDIEGAIRPCQAADWTESQPQSSGAETGIREKEFDLSLFYDEEGPKKLAEVAECVAEVSRQYFGIRVSVNNEEGTLGRPDFDSELQLVASTRLLMLLIDSKPELHPRMTYIAVCALQSHSVDHVMLVDIGCSAELPALLQGLRPFRDVDAWLDQKDGDISKSAIHHLFHFLLEGSAEGKDIGNVKQSQSSLSSLQNVWDIQAGL